jgi:translation initiation factor IF-3
MNKDKKRQNFVRVNEQIRFSPVRVVKDKVQLGVMRVEEARRLAKDEGLDLVEIVPNARPPVCEIIDYGKFRYQQSIKEKEKKQKAKQTEIKEIRLSVKIADNDVDTKGKTARRFLMEGKKVQFNLLFRNRELAHQEEGFKVVQKIIKEVEDICKVELHPKMEGKRIICRVEPING